MIQKAVGNLKERPKDEKQAVAIGTAGAVVVILIIGWAFIFLKGLRQEQATSGQAYEIPPQDVTATPVTQTYQSYNATQQPDQFGLPPQQ